VVAGYPESVGEPDHGLERKSKVGVTYPQPPFFTLGLSRYSLAFLISLLLKFTIYLQ